MKTSVKVPSGVEELVGTHDGNLRLLERSFNVSVNLGEDAVEIEGGDNEVRRAQKVLEEYADLVESGSRFDSSEVESFLRIAGQDPEATLKGLAEAGRPRTFGKKSITPKSLSSAPTWMRSSATTWFLESDLRAPARRTWRWPWPWTRC